MHKLLMDPRDLMWLWQVATGDEMQCVCKGNGGTGPRKVLAKRVGQEKPAEGGAQEACQIRG